MEEDEVQGASQKIGLPPGTPVLVGTAAEPTRIRVTRYDAASMESRDVEGVEGVEVPRDGTGVTWVEVIGLADVDRIKAIGACFGVHPLAIEDVVHLGQRPKLETYDNSLFCVVRRVAEAEPSKGPRFEQVSLVLGPNYVLSFFEREIAALDALRERIRSGRGRIRSSGADYLLNGIVDVLVDEYFAAVERLEEELQALEEVIVEGERVEKDWTHRLHRVRRTLLEVRRNIGPMRDVLGALIRHGDDLFDPRTKPYLRDVQDHVLRVVESLDAMSERAVALHEQYLSWLGARASEISTILTVVATIFIPLTFITGVYGMNFENMPELRWRYGYPAVWAVMVTLALLLLRAFKKRGFL